MPLRQYGKAKAHVFLDVEMEEVVRPMAPHEIKRAGWGSKVVITVGPSCQDVGTLVKLLQAGVTCARVDLSWGTKDYHLRSLNNLAEAMRQTRLLCSVWLDTTGREVVVRQPIEYDASGWPIQHGQKIEAQKDQVIKITTDPTAEASETVFPVNYPGFPDIVEVGQTLQIGRYLATGSEGLSLYVEVVDVSDTEVTCVASNNATLSGLLSVMVCHTGDEDFRADFGLPLLTEHDVDCIRSLGSQFEVDFVSVSYCNSVDDLYTMRALLDSLAMKQTKIIAKIERKAAVRNFEGIAHVSDGIIISRGNLGLDFEPEVMALLQKRIISRCNQLGKPVLITRIVDTMVSSPRPTRAEATDVANAVLDGVDGLLLGAETLRGSYPVQTVDTVLKLTGAAEQHFDYRTHHEVLMGEAYEEEVSLGRADISVADFNLYGRPPDTTPPAVRHVRSYGGGLSQRSTEGRESALRPGMADGLSGPAAMQGIGNGPAAVGGHAPQLSQHAQRGVLGVPADSAITAHGGQSASGEAAAMASGAAPPYMSFFGSLPTHFLGSSPQMARVLQTHAPYMTKLESLASSATRTAEKINAGLIIVMVQTGRTVSLVAKYRPPMPIMAVVVPTLRSNSLGWELEGKYLARQTLVLRGVVPMLAAPMSDAAGSEDLLSEAIHSAYLQRMVAPLDYVVCITSHRGSMVVKVVQVNRSGTGLRSMGGENSRLIGGEMPDVIPDRSPFGASMPPMSPRLVGVGLMSPSRTLSGRPSLVMPTSPPTAGAVNTFPLGTAARMGAGHMLISTPSELIPYDDVAFARVAADLASSRPGRPSVRTGSPLAGAGGSMGAGAFSSPTSASTASPGRDPSSPQFEGGRGGAILSPITETAHETATTTANGVGSKTS